MGQLDKFCQSCGMPMAQDKRGGGTEKNGAKNTKYCSFCYRSGRFVDDFKTSKEMVNFVKEELREQGYGPIKRFWYTFFIPQLDRWKSK